MCVCVCVTVCTCVRWGEGRQVCVPCDHRSWQQGRWQTHTHVTHTAHNSSHTNPPAHLSPRPTRCPSMLALVFVVGDTTKATKQGQSSLTSPTTNTSTPAHLSPRPTRCPSMLAMCFLFETRVGGSSSSWSPTKNKPPCSPVPQAHQMPQHARDSERGGECTLAGPPGGRAATP